MTTLNSPRVEVTRAGAADRPTLDRLWTMFRHDMSAVSGVLPNSCAEFRSERLEMATSQPGWAAYILRMRDAAVGLCIIRGLDAPERVISSFFLVHGARRAGHGRRAVDTVTQQHPGRWAVAYQEANLPAAAFWPSIAQAADPDWTHERRAVPGRPDLPPDSWVRSAVTPTRSVAAHQ